jgi:hypothetical protein
MSEPSLEELRERAMLLKHQHEVVELRVANKISQEMRDKDRIIQSLKGRMTVLKRKAADMRASASQPQQKKQKKKGTQLSIFSRQGRKFTVNI